MIAIVYCYIITKKSPEKLFLYEFVFNKWLVTVLTETWRPTNKMFNFVDRDSRWFSYGPVYFAKFLKELYVVIYNSWKLSYQSWWKMFVWISEIVYGSSTMWFLSTTLFTLNKIVVITMKFRTVQCYLVFIQN